MSEKWRSMKSAPADGTMVIVLETPNGEHFNVMPAMYMNLGGGDPRLGQKPEGYIGWVGIAGSRYGGEGGDCELPVRTKTYIITPLAWKPISEAPTLTECHRKRRKIYG